MTRGYRHLMTRTLPQLNECRRVAEKLLTRRRQRCSALVPNEQGSPKLLLEGADTRADCGLTDIQALGSPDETTGRDDLEKGFGDLGVHIRSSIKHVLNCQLNSFVGCVRR